MQRAEIILTILSKKSKKDKDFTFERLYRNLFNADFYLLAYSKIYNKEGNMTPGIDGSTIDGFNKGIILDIVEDMKKETYQPKPVKRTYIPKKDGKRRPLGIACFKDKLVQEVVRSILEAIYEPLFCDTSHGFRADHSCHTALMQIKTTCRGTNWIIEGDIQGFFDNIDHEILLQLLAKKISDGRFIELIRRFLKAGYLEFEQLKNSLSGTPQGQIASPVLANIYLHELDIFMEDLQTGNNKGERRKCNLEYTRLCKNRRTAIKRGDRIKADHLLKKLRKLPSQDPMDENYIRVKYTRYCDDFVICIIGSKKLAQKIKNLIAKFLQQELKLTLNLEKTLITNLKDQRVNFLNYEISKSRENTQVTQNTSGIKKRSINETIQLLVPKKVINEKLKPFVKKGKSHHHFLRMHLPVLDIIEQYNAEIRGLYNYYSLATDVSSKLGKFRYYHYYSLAKTIARKGKISVKKAFDKYSVDVKRKDGTGTRKLIGIKYQVGNKEKTLSYFKDSLTKQNKINKNAQDIYLQSITRNCQLIQRLNANQCEVCNITGSNDNFEVHHVRKLKDLKKKYAKRGAKPPTHVIIMSKMNRKTLVLCKSCHHKLHVGKL